MLSVDPAVRQTEAKSATLDFDLAGMAGCSDVAAGHRLARPDLEMLVVLPC